MRRHLPARSPAPSRTLAAWRVVLLCLMMALLPVRGWAWTTMAVPTEAAMPPCHGHADAPPTDSADHAVNDAVDDTPAPTTDTPHAGCSLCELCHAGVLPPQVMLWSGEAVPPGSAPRWTPAPDTGRQGTDGLFRPPRG